MKCFNVGLFIMWNNGNNIWGTNWPVDYFRRQWIFIVVANCKTLCWDIRHNWIKYATSGVCSLIVFRFGSVEWLSMNNRTSSEQKPTWVLRRWRRHFIQSVTKWRHAAASRDSRDSPLIQPAKRINTHHSVTQEVYGILYVCRRFWLQYTARLFH